jgi:CRISPR system Cascade subunit CasA
MVVSPKPWFWGNTLDVKRKNGLLATFPKTFPAGNKVPAPARFGERLHVCLILGSIIMAANKPPAKSPVSKKAAAKNPIPKILAVEKSKAVNPAVKRSAGEKPSAKRSKPADSPARFNLIDEPWLPITDKGLVSLRQAFTDSAFRSLASTGVSKIALLKLLIAICQAAYTPKDKDDWLALGAAGLAKMARGYLENHRNDFYLYGKKPFLQMPAIAAADKVSFGIVMPEIGTGKNISRKTISNTTILTQSQQERTLSDAEKAVLIVQLMGFALGGKKTDNSVVLSPNYQGKRSEKGKPSTGKPGASVGFLGCLHNFLTGANLLETLWLNTLAFEDIEGMRIFTRGLGPVPWETPPKGEGDSIAEALKHSLMGRLIPFSRFVLLTDDGLHYSEGILHPNYQDGITDPSMAIQKLEKGNRILWADPSKRPWRNLASLLGFLLKGEQYFDCPYIRIGLNRISSSRISKKLSIIGIWSAGLRVSSNAGEQYVSGTDDYIEAETFFESSSLGENLYINLKNEMSALEKLSRILYGKVLDYYKELKVEGDPFARQAVELYWQLCGQKFQHLANVCGADSNNKLVEFRARFLRYVQKSYAVFCPRGTARQLNAWAKNYPNLSKFAAKKNDDEGIAQ